MVFEQAELAFGLYTTSTDFFLLCKKANLDDVQYGGHSPLPHASWMELYG